MANFGRVKTWGTEVLQPTDLNAEFDNIINNITSGIVCTKFPAVTCNGSLTALPRNE